MHRSRSASSMATYRSHHALPETRTTMTVSCTPHYKDDVDKPWCTREGILNITLFLSPKSTMSLEDLAKLIEEFLHTIHADSAMGNRGPHGTFQTNTNVKYEMYIQNMIFQGESMPRSAQMSTLQAKTFLRDQEPFSVVYELRFSVIATTDFERRGFLQSCCPCFFARRDLSRDDVPMHSAPPVQQMNIRQ